MAWATQTRALCAIHADRRDIVGQVVEATPEAIEAAFGRAVAAGPLWSATPPGERAFCLLRAADLLEARTESLLGLIVREAGKSLPDAIAEVREAVDFLRYYAVRVRESFDNGTHRPLGPVVCISPWNFPLSIFTGQVAAALAAGNPVLAKPAEETPLIAAQAAAIMQEAGVPADVVQLLPGAGEVGAALVADARTQGVVFTGSTDVARLIQRQLAARLGPTGEPIPLIAETGGQNALIVDSSALAEQVIADVLMSAFDSAGQRCSALRVLCLQEDVADRILGMLKGAMAELSVGNPDRLSTDVGPVITEEARQGLLAHVQAMRDAGRPVFALSLPDSCRHGTFVAPTLIELSSLSELKREVFGPVLHVLRYRRDGLDALIEAINATGYGLTFGLHTRIDETIAHVSSRVAAGNVYVNRNLIGAVVGVQPFGGHRLSGTGPKAGGPLYLRRLLARCPDQAPLPAGKAPGCGEGMARLARAAWAPCRSGALHALHGTHAARADAGAARPGRRAQHLPAGAPRRGALHRAGRGPDAAPDQCRSRDRQQGPGRGADGASGLAGAASPLGRRSGRSRQHALRSGAVRWRRRHIALDYRGDGTARRGDRPRAYRPARLSSGVAGARTLDQHQHCRGRRQRDPDEHRVISLQ